MEELKIGLLFLIFLGLFLIGMQLLKHGLTALSSKSFKKILQQSTNHPIKSFLVGIVATAILQSSSAVMVMVIGFVTSGLIPFTYTIGIILGSNIGTTVTTEILAFRVDQIIPYLIIFGFVSMMFRKKKVYSVGCVMFGLACIFLSMQQLENLAIPISSIPSFKELFKACEQNIFLALLFSTIMTGIIQSSTAMIGLAMAFSGELGLTLKTGIVFVLGANIGTCITAMLASVKTNVEGKYTAYAHLWLNVISVLFFLPFIDFWSEFSSRLAHKSSVQIAHFSFLFNTISSLVFLPFSYQYGSFIIWFYHLMKRRSLS